MKPAHIDVPSGYIVAARRLNNTDGAGVMYVENGRVQIEKDIGKHEDDVKDLYERNQHRSLAFHVRNKTLGPVNLENSHPFIVTSKDLGHKYDVALMHNGTVQSVQVDPLLSDSHNLAVYFLRPVLEQYPEMYTSDSFWHLVSGLIGRNKLVLLDNKGRFLIVNSGLGRTLEPFGVWVSSDARLNPPSLTATSTSRLPDIKARRDIAKGVNVDGHWVIDVDGNKHFRASDPTLTIEDLVGSDREAVFDLVRKFPSLATDFLITALDEMEKARDEVMDAVG